MEIYGNVLKIVGMYGNVWKRAKTYEEMYGNVLKCIKMFGNELK